MRYFLAIPPFVAETGLAWNVCRTSKRLMNAKKALTRPGGKISGSLGK